MSTDDFEILITVRGGSDLDEDALTVAARYLVARAAKTSPDRRIDWTSVQVSATRCPKGA